MVVVDLLRLYQLLRQRRSCMEVSRSLTQGERDRGSVESLLAACDRPPPLGVPREVAHDGRRLASGEPCA